MSANYISYIKIFRNPRSSYEERNAAVKKLIAERDTSSVPDLIKILKNDADDWNRCMAAEILGEIGDTRAVEPLVMNIKKTASTQKADGSFSFSSYDESYFEALGKLGDPGFDALVGILQEKKDMRRGKILSILFDNFRSRAFDPAVEALNDLEEIRRWACIVLGWIGDKRALPLLVKELQKTTKAATDGLICLNDPDAIAPLQESLNNNQYLSPKEKEAISHAINSLKQSQMKSINAT